MVSRLSLALVASALLATTATAQAAKVTVHRGAQTHEVSVDAWGNVIAPHTKVIHVEPARPVRQQETEAKPVPSSAVAGRSLWFLDENGERLVACRLFKTFRVSERVIRCRSEDIEQLLLDARRPKHY